MYWNRFLDKNISQDDDYDDDHIVYVCNDDYVYNDEDEALITLSPNLYPFNPIKHFTLK